MYLVTGGAGFIGSNLVAALSEGGARVAVCDRLGSGDKWRNLAKRELHALVPPEGLDDLLAAEGASVKAVLHLGAITSTTETDADLLLRVNFGLSQRLWRWCAEAGVPLIYASSAATYGDGSEGFDDDNALEALARLRPMNAYGWSKHLFDRWVLRRLEEGGPRPPQWAGLKFFNVYGPNEYHKLAQASVALHVFEQVREGGVARLFQSHRPDYPDGGQLRDFVWVGDCVAVMTWLLDNPGVSGLFNLGTGQARSFADLARAVFRELNLPEAIDYVPTPEAIRAKYQYFTQARMDRLTGAGYTAGFTPLEEGVGRYLRDYLMKDDPFR